MKIDITWPSPCPSSPASVAAVAVAALPFLSHITKFEWMKQTFRVRNRVWAACQPQDLFHFFKDFIYLLIYFYTEGREGERNIGDQAHGLTKNWTNRLWVCRQTLNPLSHTSQGKSQNVKVAVHGPSAKSAEEACPLSWALLDGERWEIWAICVGEVDGVWIYLPTCPRNRNLRNQHKNRSLILKPTETLAEGNLTFFCTIVTFFLPRAYRTPTKMSLQPWLVCSVDWAWTTNQRVTGSIPSQGTYLDCGLGPQWGAQERQPHIDVSLPLFLLPFHSLKINK